MEKVINLLNDIENKAEKILSHVSDNKAELNQENEQKIAALKKQLEQDTKQKLDNLKLKANQDAEEEIKRLQEENQAYLSRLELNFKENSDKYVDDIVKRITTVTP